MIANSNNFEFNILKKEKIKTKVLRVEKISKSFNNKDLFKDINFTMAKKQKKALVGNNGSGKSTLLKIMAGEENSDFGRIETNNMKIEYLPQELSIKNDLNLNILDYLKKITHIMQIEKTMKELAEDLADKKKLKEYGKLQEQYERLNGYDFESIAEIILSGFGLEKYLDKKVEELSGGEKSKLMFVGALLRSPDMLLLDEPTSNLDLQSIIWLENFIKQSDMACLVVSHDKIFLDNIIGGTIEIDSYKKNIIEQSGSYSEFLERKQKKNEREKNEYKKGQKKISNLEKIAKKKKQWAIQGSGQSTKDKDKYLRGHQRDRSSKMGSGAKAIDRQIKRIKETTKQPFQEKELQIKIEFKEISTKNSIQLDQLKVGYKDGFSLGPIDLDIKHGEKIVFVGDNGAGKSTLLKTIAQKIKPISGKIEIGKQLNVGNFMQNHEDLPLDQTIFSYIKKNSNIRDDEIHRILNHFEFQSDYIDKKIKNLSPGERTKLILAKFSVKKANVLILDEPTNYLDIRTMKAIEIALKNYEGTIIMSSHDRYFLEKINPDKFYLVADKKVKYLSDYSKHRKSIKNKVQGLTKKVQNFL